MQAQLKLLIILLIFSSSTFAKKRICGNVLQTYLMRVCTFAYEKTPCFNSRFPTSKGIRSMFVIEKYFLLYNEIYISIYFID